MYGYLAEDVPDELQTMLTQQHFAATLTELLTEEEIQGAIQLALNLDPSLEAVLEFMQRDHHSTPALVKARFKDYKWQGKLLLYNSKILVPDDEGIKRDLVADFHNSPLTGVC